MPAKKWWSAGAFTKYVAVGASLLKALDDENVRRQLVDASEGMRAWAQARREALGATGHRVNPIRMVKSRLGHRRLERRLDDLFAVIPEFEAFRPELAAELRSTQVELRRAATVTARLSATKRLRARRHIYKRLDEIERRLIDAILVADKPPAAD